MPDPEHGTSGGFELSEQRIREFADDAERGYDTGRLRERPRRGRPPLGQEAATVFHVRLERALRAALERRADEEETTPSALVRQALRSFLERGRADDLTADKLTDWREDPPVTWTGAISFGLVIVPVRLYTAVRSETAGFRLLSRKDHSPVHPKPVSEATGEELTDRDLVWGYETSPGKYVVIEPEELDALASGPPGRIDIEDFVDPDEIDPVYFHRPYHVRPAVESATKPYRLLVEAMAKTGKVAVAHVTMRGKQRLAALRAKDDAMVLLTMNYDTEVVPVSQVEGFPWGGDTEVSEREIALAEQLIASMTSVFDPGRYKDEHLERVRELAEAKAAGEEVVTPETSGHRAEVVDLTAALEKSLGNADRRRQEAG